MNNELLSNENKKLNKNIKMLQNEYDKIKNTKVVNRENETKKNNKSKNCNKKYEKEILNLLQNDISEGLYKYSQITRNISIITQIFTLLIIFLYKK